MKRSRTRSRRFGELLKLLNLKGCIVTIDALGTQKEIASQIREQKGHYVLALKGNQLGLQDAMRHLFNQGMETDFVGVKHEVYETTETGHGRTDERVCHVIEIPKDHPQCALDPNYLRRVLRNARFDA